MEKKSNTGKTLLVGAALSLVMLSVIVVAGLLLFGSDWNGWAVTLIAFATGLAGYGIAKHHYQSPLGLDRKNVTRHANQATPTPRSTRLWH